MRRVKKLVIRLNSAEREAVRRLAQVERLPASTLARRLLLQEADRRGLGSERENLERKVLHAAGIDLERQGAER